MSRKMDALRVLVETQRQTIETQERELRQLRTALREYAQDPRAVKIEIKLEDEDVFMDGADPEPAPCRAVPGEEVSETVGSEDSEDDEDVKPVWCDIEEKYICGLCEWEIVEGMCPKCYQRYDNYDVHLDPEGNRLPTSDNVFFMNDGEHRFTTARGTTPLLEVDPARLRSDTVAYGYGGRVDEYKALLARGATRLMCETFDLSFSHETGIVLEMKDDLFEEWAGEELYDAASWEIHLGRELHLDADDEDGSMYIDGALDEAMLFGAYTETHVFWETVQTGPGHWVTRPTKELEAAEQPSRDSSPTDTPVCERLAHHLKPRPKSLAYNDYHRENSGDEDEECDSVDDEDGQLQLGLDDGGGWGPDGPREPDNGNGMDGSRIINAPNNGDDEEDGEDTEDSFDSDFDSEEELSGDEPVLAGNIEYFRDFYNPQRLPLF